MTEILEFNLLPNERLESSWGTLWLGIRTSVGSKIEYRRPPGSKNEIQKLKELQNERLESSWGALWLGIQTFFVFLP